MHTEEYKRLKFCRYADDFVIGIIGTKHNAETIKQRVIEFLRYSLNLDVSIEKTRICKGEKGIEFLSYGIKTQYKDKELKMKIKRKIYNQKNRNWKYTPERTTIQGDTIL